MTRRNHRTHENETTKHNFKYHAKSVGYNISYIRFTLLAYRKYKKL